jgi:glycosyltransferase involved in cell wall biosynthesis
VEYVLFVLLYVDFPSYMGLSKRCEALMNSLRFKKNIKVYVYSPVIFGPSSDLIKRLIKLKGVYVKHIKLPIPRRILRKIYRGFLIKGVVTLLYSFIALFHLLTDLRKLTEDRRFILQYEHIVLAPLAYVIKKIHGGRIIADDINLLFIRVGDFRRRLLQTLEYVFLVKADIILTASSKTMAYASKINKRVVYVQNALTNIRSANYCLEKTRRLLEQKGRKENMVFVGNLTFHQNIKAVITLYKIMLHLVKNLNVKNIRLNVIGGPLHNIPETILHSDLVKKGYVVFHGRVTEKEKEKIFSESLIGLLPYFSDLVRWGGQMTKTLEMLSNCMIVITGSEGADEIDGIDRVHFLVAKDAGEMINLLLGVVKDPSSYVKVAVNGCDLVRANNSVDAIRKRYPTIIEELFSK